MRDVNSPEFLADTDRLAKIINATIGRIETDPAVIVPVLMRLLCVNIVTETMHLKQSEVITNTQAAVKNGLITARKFLETVQAAEQTANDEATPQLDAGAGEAGQVDHRSGPSAGLDPNSDGRHDNS